MCCVDIFIELGQSPVSPTNIYTWSEAWFDGVNGFAVLEAVNASYLYWEFINSATNVVVDRMALVQSTDNNNHPPAIRLSTAEIVGIVIAICFLVLIVAVFIWKVRGKSIPQKTSLIARKSELTIQSPFRGDINLPIV